MSATFEIIIVAAIVTASASYAIWRFADTLRHPDDPCSNCSGCALKGALKDPKRSKNEKTACPTCENCKNCISIPRGSPYPNPS